MRRSKSSGSLGVATQKPSRQALTSNHVQLPLRSRVIRQIEMSAVAAISRCDWVVHRNRVCRPRVLYPDVGLCSFQPTEGETMPWKLKNATAVDVAPDWLQPYCTQFLRNLSDQGYAAVTLRSYDAAAALLCHEVSRRGLRSDQLVGATLTKARAAALGRMHPNRYDQKKYCLDRFIDALVEANVAERPTPKTVRSSPLDRLRSEYVAYLRDQRGLTEATIYHCVSFLNRFMASRFGDTLGNLNDITPHDIVDFLSKLRSDGKAPRDKTPPSHLRNLFRFMLWIGKT
jgi:hypothetical protein